MAADRIDPSELIPEADLLEQHTPLDPSSLTDPDPRTDVEPGSAIAEASGDAVDEADRLDQHAPVFGDGQDYPHETAGAGVAVMADPLVEVSVRVYADFAEHVTLADVLPVIDRRRIDPGTSSTALPELVERLARQRLADRLERLAPDARVRPPAHRVPLARPGSGSATGSRPCRHKACESQEDGYRTLLPATPGGSHVADQPCARLRLLLRTGRYVIRRKEDFEVQVNFGQYFLADPDSYPGMGGPDPKEFPDFSSPGPLRRLQGAEGLVFIAATTHTGTVPVRYLLVDERPATSADYPQLVGELTVLFPTGRAELRGLMADAGSDVSLLKGHAGTYVVRLEARATAGEAHQLSVWPASSG